ncbi:MAG TPA: Rha family transcriptional regulator [Allosphingosinicella sp.]|jgi:Rha family phage regulatory protein|nr:Rha family transcriptional regulator [Allosphingosinicella sp.]
MSALVSIRDGEVRASSQDVAAAFDKAHKDVLRAIDRLIALAPEISGRNFAPRDFISRGRSYRGYEMDRDGFSLLAMGFTGARALEWKLKFLEAFRRMEQALSQSLAVNDNGLAKLHPLLRTPEGRDAIGRGMETVRRMMAARGRDAAIAQWKELGLPLPPNIDDFSAASVERALDPPAARKGELYQWLEGCAVRLSPGSGVHLRTLWESYLNWCVGNDLLPYGQDKFKWHLRNHFGPANYDGRDVFSLQIGRKASASSDRG